MEMSTPSMVSRSKMFDWRRKVLLDNGKEKLVSVHCSLNTMRFINQI